MAANSLFTLEDLSLQVAQNYGDTSDITIAKCEKFINRALLRINEMGDWSWLMKYDATFNTTSGTETYTLGAGVKKVYALYYSDNVRRKLRLMDDRRFREIFTYNVTPTGTPLWYRLAGRDTTYGRRQVKLFPIPNATIAMYYDYRQEISLLTATTDDVRVVTGMPDHMVDALIELATAIGYREQDDGDYESAMEEAMARLQRLLEDDLTEIDDRVRMANFEGDSVYYGDPVLPPQYGDFLG